MNEEAKPEENIIIESFGKARYSKAKQEEVMQLARDYVQYARKEILLQVKAQITGSQASNE